MHRKIVVERLAEPVSESPNLFGELDRARRKDWSKYLRKFWHIGDGKAFRQIKDNIRRARTSPPKVIVQTWIGAQTNGDQEGLLASRRVNSATSGFLPKVTEPNFTISMKLKEIWGISTNCRIVRRARPNVPTFNPIPRIQPCSPQK
uniref:Uncharacterized protein n=1 Tax=Solanum tuberosum TaxID=4113 RepID=M1DCE1_SOLTU